ncbi:MAG: hypothetical protein KGH60_03790 [Candidatus Micrarchaeota archaeon]|nr:hypothetical protein [Candidatus Micrarchaeota archaeon]
MALFKVFKCKCGHDLIASKDVDFQLKDVIPYLHCKMRSGENFNSEFFVTPVPPTDDDIKTFNPRRLITVGCMEKACECKWPMP